MTADITMIRRSDERPFIVTSHLVTVVTDLVYARSNDEAIRRVSLGQGDRIDSYVDEDRPPMQLRAEPEPVESYNSSATSTVTTNRGASLDASSRGVRVGVSS
ncbi:hypothetical protein ACFWHR_12210 [Leucobacter sp. NPDC058333]|uniref:hypothetical protein n=1 Tax=Leucobacter sp. NPDC058333 TaxID=3346450 RepID=UPI0036507432